MINHLVRLKHLLAKTSMAMCVASGIIAFLAMLVTITDITGRYVLSKPLFGAYELVELSMVPIVFLAIAAPEANGGGHIRMTMLLDMAPASWRRSIEVMNNLLAATVILLLAWRSLKYAFDTMRFGEASLLLYIPKAPFLFLLTFGLAFLAIQYILTAALLAAGAENKGTPVAAAHAPGDAI
jgi:TRAP-type C4-dicarboxylate transport system permease small subunit